MSIPLYYVMQPREMAKVQLPERWAIIGCHFSGMNSGITYDFPQGLPPGGLLVLDDSIPYADHCNRRVVSQLSSLLDQYRFSGLYLDFERPVTSETLSLVDSIATLCRSKKLTLAVPPAYGYEGMDACTVYLPAMDSPTVPAMEPDTEPYSGPRVLELAPIHAMIQIGQNGAVLHEMSAETLRELLAAAKPTIHVFPSSGISYFSIPSDDYILFCFFDTDASIARRLELAASYGYQWALGLFQELRAVPHADD